MLAISFDLTVSEVERLHPRSIPAAYGEIGRTLARYGYQRIQGSVYLGQDEDLANLMMATSDLKALPWFPASVRDIRVFRVELWSDITGMMKGSTFKR